MDIKVPDIGDFSDVPVVSILVSVGDTIAEEDPLIELESDKATMEVPSPAAGKITEIKVAEGDTASEGTPIMAIETAGAAEEAPKPEAPGNATPAPQAATGTASGPGDKHADLVVLGSGPGGYSAAFRAADLGKSVILIERYPTLGGVCLNVGCIPSKALLHVANVMEEARGMAAHGISFGKPKIDLEKLREFKSGVIGKLTGGLAGMARARKVRVVTGKAEFTGPNTIEVQTDKG